MTPKLIDEYEYINRRLKEIEEEKERARNNDTEKPKTDEIDYLSVADIYPG